FQPRVGHDNFALIHVSLVPDMHGEQKTKPTQTTIHSLRRLGLLSDLSSPSLLGSQPLQPATKEKISRFFHVAPEQVFGMHDVSSVYHVPLLLQSQGIVDYLRKRFNLPAPNISKQMVQTEESLQKRWKDFTTGQERLFDSVSVALVGKYTDLKDSSMSVTKSAGALGFPCTQKAHHTCSSCPPRCVSLLTSLQWVESFDLEPETQETNPAKYHDAWWSVRGKSFLIIRSS
ncbi:CTP synthase N-terminus-domain-containing protein, partial [Mycena albidolilacea]